MDLHVFYGPGIGRSEGEGERGEKGGAGDGGETSREGREREASRGRAEREARLERREREAAGGRWEGEERYVLGEEESAHCARVLRLGAGTEIVVVDGEGTWCRCVLERAEAKGCAVRVVERVERFGWRPWGVHVAMAPPKNGERMEWFVEKATEMGVTEVTPLACERSERRRVNVERLRRVAVAAMKQSGRAYLPVVHEMTGLREFVERARDERGGRFIAHCGEGERRGLWEACRPAETSGETRDEGEMEGETGGEMPREMPRDAERETVTVLIGPEGDFSPAEVAMAREAGFVAVSLGDFRLRTETAGLVACETVVLRNEAGRG